MAESNPEAFSRRFLAWLLLRHRRGYDALKSDLRFRLLYRLGIPHESDFRALRYLVPAPQPLVVDVGGNVGQSVLSTLAVLPTASVVSFEPNSMVLARLQGIAKRISSLKVMPFALADMEGQRELVVPVYRGNVMTGLASFDEKAARGWLSSNRMLGFDPDELTVQRLPVQVRTLDSFDLSPQLLKLDVQGAEAMVIRGATATIHRSRPVVMAETIHFDSEVHALLKSAGYRLFEYGRRSFRSVTDSSGIRRLNQFLIPEEIVERLSTDAR